MVTVTVKKHGSSGVMASGRSNLSVLAVPAADAAPGEEGYESDSESESEG